MEQMRAEGIESYPLTPDLSLAIRMCDDVLSTVLSNSGMTHDGLNPYGLYIEDLQDIANRYRIEAS